ncbi:LolA family protein [Halobacterium yunchengense]|uniref:LolA family protein n=1 Tax=Halobacterium yunchengense TaxID=3108497 RepID=UPI003008F59D
MDRRALLPVALAALLAASGCIGIGVLGDDARQRPPDVDVAERYESLETLNATQVANVSFGDRTNRTEVRVRVDFTTEPATRLQRVLAPERRAGDRFAVNASGASRYDASENTVTRFETATAAAVRSRGEYFASVVDAARDDGTAPAAGVSPLPVVPQTAQAPGLPADVEGFDVEYLGTRTVAGRTAHGFELTAVSDAALAVDRTLWLDAEYYYPLETSQTFEYDGETVESTARLTDVTFDAELSGDALDLDAPPDATVETLDVGVETFESVEAVSEAAPLSVPEPDVPDGYAFERAQLYTGNATQVSLQYATDDGDRLTVTKMAYVSNGTGGLDGETVSVNGRDARYLTTGQNSLLSWACEDVQFSVVATDLDRAALVAVGESVDCR